MVKIKRKVEMTCGEFAKYMVDKFGFSSYEIKLSDGYWVGNPEREYYVSIHLPPSKVSDLPDITITKSDVVIFEVEEEITEDTELNEILLIGNDGLFIESYNNHSINGVLSNNGGYYDETLMLIMKPEPTIIWTSEKGLVE
ncbi:hypothetical protein [Staphylococcus pseudoxylosus]|uniref:hypothetical protein n=1 Tax=Staphylococcus pseudoxylosus TaxID=2282419 RepID=UPI002DBC4338|nr:hypothetical protein [Staphylococcus pseudoxylosus]MEB7752544.1 hypothetical protein [Staphylococcus pseudoxylosus]